MNSLFDKAEAKKVVKTYSHIPEELAVRVYTSRLIGKDENLVLHGGGNTSVKVAGRNILGDERRVLFVKGSGRDMATIEPDGFTGLDLDFLGRFRVLESLTDEEMENQLRIRKIEAESPEPSVEALLHAFLPPKYVDHTHADAILVLTNQKNGAEMLREALGPKVAVIPYSVSGLPLAKAVAEAYESAPDIEAIVVSNHGIFTFADDAETSYSRMIEYVCRAESHIDGMLHAKAAAKAPDPVATPADHTAVVARLAQAVRGACAHRDGDGQLRRFYTEVRNPPDIVEASLSNAAPNMCRTGVLTPDHAIRTKNRAVHIERVPEDDEELKKTIAESVDRYKSEYADTFENQVKEKGVQREMLDPFPRVFLVAGVGLVALGSTRKSARIAADIAQHTFRAKVSAAALGEYAPISDSHVFDMEYWSLQQKKLDRTRAPKLQGQVAIVTGAAGAIGFGIADRLLASGAVVAICDIDESRLQTVHSLLAEKYEPSRVESLVFDITDFQAVEKALEIVSRNVGGIDLVVPNAGIAHVAKIEDLDPETFQRVTSVNLMGTFNIIKAAIPVIRRQGTGGNVVLISSKNVFDPGAAFGAYSASKAAAHQISKIAALELAELGVRVNMVNPDAVFGDDKVSSKLWDLIGPDRMKSRGLDPDGLKEYYRQRNLLKIAVNAEHVGNAVVFFASELTPTTGATLPVDGGVPAAFPK
ncbi:MAG: bifunctional aldolase/short-chain dehydrogenase [Proteobacteria bacterium]|nr:bifunctional aldolase/short-chain dehydrogenase [Pseudomonadota bacterium]